FDGLHTTSMQPGSPPRLFMVHAEPNHTIATATPFMEDTMNAHPTLKNRYVALFALLVPATGALGAGCTTTASDPAADDEKAAGSAAAPDVFTLEPPGDPRWDPQCTPGGGLTFHNPEWPYHASGSCPAVDAYNFDVSVHDPEANCPEE